LGNLAFASAIPDIPMEFLVITDKFPAIALRLLPVAIDLSAVLNLSPIVSDIAPVMTQLVFFPRTDRSFRGRQRRAGK
jgi:hypothetical protein